MSANKVPQRSNATETALADSMGVCFSETVDWEQPVTAQVRAESPGPDATVTCSLHAATMPQPMQSTSSSACTILSFRMLAQWRASKRSTPDPAANNNGPAAAAADVEQQVRQLWS